MFKNLTDRQKKIALAVAGAAGLALIVMLGRRGGAPAEAPAAAGEDVTVAGSAGAPPFGSTFADNGEAAAGLSTAITQGLGEVGAGLGDVSSALVGVPTRDEVEQAVAAGIATAGMTATPSAPQTTRIIVQTQKPAAQPQPAPPARPQPKLYAGHTLAWWQNPANAKKGGKWRWPGGGGYVHSRRFEGR